MYLPTLTDEEAAQIAEDSGSDEEEAPQDTTRLAKRRRVAGAAQEFNPDFKLDFSDRVRAEDAEAEMRAVRSYLKKTVASTLEEKISTKRKQLNLANLPISGNAQLSDEEDDVQQLVGTKLDDVKLKKKKGGKKNAKEGNETDGTAEPNDGKNQPPSHHHQLTSFSQLNLSRAMLRSISSATLSEPTPVQSAVIPLALAGRDVCACAETGTGKTAAFVIPILERLMHRSHARRATRVLVLLPTRELAVQVFHVFRKLAANAHVEICLCAGGMDIKSQEAALRALPDIVVATPGRLVDHLHNAPSFTLSTIEVLVLDEADRMLDEQFSLQLRSLIKECASNRQTLLFSATMTERIDELAALSLRTPARVFINPATQTASHLHQEFIRVRPQREQDREAMIAALVTRNFPQETIIFCRTKRDCQHLQIVLGLLGVKAGQIHSSLTQTQRLTALTAFKNRQMDVLCCTDLAARGLDIQGISTVINASMPSTLAQYVHRVGRTARAGRTGRSVSLVGEEERKLLKEIVTANPDRTMQQRILSPEVIDAYRDRVNNLRDAVREIEEQEKAERALRIADEETKRAEQRLLNGETERDGRVWIQGARDPEKKKRLKNEKEAKKRAGQSAESTAQDREVDRVQDFHMRQAKRGRKQKRLRTVEDTGSRRTKQRQQKKKASSFTSALTNVSRVNVKKHLRGPDDNDFRAAKKRHAAEQGDDVRRKKK